MQMTKRPRVSLGKMIAEEFLRPLMLTQATLADAMGVSINTPETENPAHW